MTLISLTDCCHLLAVDSKTLRRWMSLCQLEALPHPTDARIKCVTSDMVQQLAATHRRTLLDRPGTDFQQEISPKVEPTVVSGPVLSDVSMDFPALIDSLTKQLGSLQAHVASLQHQLTLLTDQLQKEQEWRIRKASTVAEKSQRSSKEKSQEKSQESPQEKSQRPSREKSQEDSWEKSQQSSQEKESTRAVANAPSIDQHKIPHVLPLVEYGVQGKYVVISPEHGLLSFEPDSPEWLAWLSLLPSFRFMGKLGHFTAHRGGSTSPNSSWYATRSIRNRSYSHSLGKTESLTVAQLEQVAALLQSHLH